MGNYPYSGAWRSGSLDRCFGRRRTRFIALLAVFYSLGPCRFGSLPGSRGLGVSRRAGALGLSPALLVLVFDSTEGNLIGLALAPLALVLAVRAAIGGSLGEGILSALLIAGLVASYPEYLPLFALVSALAIIVSAAGEVLARRATARRFAVVIMRGLAIGVVALAANPVSTHRMVAFLSGVTKNAMLSDLPPRWLTFEDFGAWLFGVLHLYQLQRFDLLSPTKVVIAIGFPLLLTALIVFGLAKRMDVERAAVAAGLIVPLPLGLYVYSHFQGGHCQYCMWKSFTFMLPFLGIGVALGTDRVILLIARLKRGLRRSALLYPLLGIVLLSVVAMGNSNVKLIEATYYTTTNFPTSLRQVTADARNMLPKSSNVLMEGSDSAHNPVFATSAMYYAAHDMNNSRLSFDVDSFATYELGAPLGADAYYSPRYQYVLTAFAGVDNGRKVLAHHSHFALERRAPIDVAIAHTGWALDPSEGATAIPWIAGQIALRVSSFRNARIAVTVTIRRPLHDHPTLQFVDSKGRPQPTSHSTDGAMFCTSTKVRNGQATLGVQPTFVQAASVRTQAGARVGSAAPAAEGRGYRERSGPCRSLPASFVQQPAAVVPGTGWFAVEPEPSGRYRWMGTSASIAIGEPRNGAQGDHPLNQRFQPRGAAPADGGAGRPGHRPRDRPIERGGAVLDPHTRRKRNGDTPPSRVTRSRSGKSGHSR